MPLYPDYLYGGSSSSFSSPYYASSSSSPPSSPYSRVGTHWPIIGYSPLTALLSANISSINTSPRRTYTPYLSSISEKSSGLGRHLFGANRHSPKSKLLYFKSRPVTINTENINLNKDNIKEKKDSVSMSGPIQRGKTVVRMHTKKLKENPGLKKAKKTPGAMLMEKFLIKEPPKEDPYNWREEYNNRRNQIAASRVSPPTSTTKEDEKMDTKEEEKIVPEDSLSPKDNVSGSNSNVPQSAGSNQQRRMSITDERLQEEAAILDSLIQEEMKEGQKIMEVTRRRRKSGDLLEEGDQQVMEVTTRRRRKSADLLEEEASPDADTSTKKTAKKKYVRQRSGDKSSRTLPLDLVESLAPDMCSNVDEDSKKQVKKRPTVKRKNPLKITVNEITVEEKVEPPKVPRKLNYEVIVEESKEDSEDASEENVVILRPKPSLAIRRRPTIKRMFSRDKEALAARSATASATEHVAQEPKTEVEGDGGSKSTDNQENLPPPVIYRTEFFLKGEDPILEEPIIDVGIKDLSSNPSTEVAPPEAECKPSEMSPKIDSLDKIENSMKPSPKFPLARNSGQQKVVDNSNNKPSSIPSNFENVNKQQNNLKPLLKSPFSKISDQQKVVESTKLDGKLKKNVQELQSTKDSDRVNSVECTTITSEKNEDDEKIESLQDSSKVNPSPVEHKENCENMEIPPPVMYRTEFTLWGSSEESDTKTVIQDGKIESFSKLNSVDSSKAVSDKSESAAEQPPSEENKTKGVPEHNQSKPQTNLSNIQKQKSETSSTSALANKTEVPSKLQPAFLNKNRTTNGSDSKVPINSSPELNKHPTTPSQDKRKQSIFGDNLIKNDNIKIFGIQVKSDTPPKVDESKVPRTSNDVKPGDKNKMEDKNEVNKFGKTVIPQFLNKNAIKPKTLGNDSAIQKKDEAISRVQIESEEFVKESTKEKEIKVVGDLLKSEKSSTDTLPKTQNLFLNKNKLLPKTDQKLSSNEKVPTKAENLNGNVVAKDIDEKTNMEDLTEKSKLVNNKKSEKVEPSLAPIFKTLQKTDVVDVGDIKSVEQLLSPEKHSKSSTNKAATETTVKLGVDQKSKSSIEVKNKFPSFGKKNAFEQNNLQNSDKEKVKPSEGKLMNGGKSSTSAEDSVIEKETHLSTDISKDCLAVKKGDEQKLFQPNLTSVNKEVKKDSENKVVGKTKDSSDSENKIVASVGTKKEVKKESLIGESKVTNSGNSLVESVKSEKVDKIEETVISSCSSINSDKLATKKTELAKSCETDKNDIKDNSDLVKKKTEVTKPIVVNEKKDVKDSSDLLKKKTDNTKSITVNGKNDVSGQVKKNTEMTKSSIVNEEKDSDEGRMTVRRRLTKHKTNLSETRMSLMKFEEKKRQEAEVSREGEEEKKTTKENVIKQSKIQSKLVSDVKSESDDVEVKVDPVRNSVNKKDEEEEEAKKEDSDDEDEDTETEVGSSEEDEESTEVESSSECESDDCDVNCHRKCEKLMPNLCGVNQKLLGEALTSVKRGSAESRERSSGSPLRHLTDSTLGLGLDEVTTTEVSRCRVTPPATTLPRFRKYSIQDFQFLKVLGKGSFGKVLLAELIGTECYYAVKCLKKDVVLEDDDVECTLIERKVLALGTNHPYLCHLFCTFQTESHLFFVMEYLNGGDLMFHIQQSGRFDEGRARFYASEIVSGLMFLHKKGIVYRDLKLDNILLDFDGHVRIADFGMCKLQIYLDRTADTFCGTPDYMAPEIIKGLAYNQCVDWWSFGILLYEMLVGQSPFSGCDEDDLFWSICNEQPHYPRFLSKEAKLILSQLLEKDSSRRLGSSELSGREVTSHVFFRDWDWFRLERRLLDPPFKPRVRHPLDVQYFDKAFTNERPRLTPIDKSILQSMDQTQFQGFSYTNPNVTK